AGADPDETIAVVEPVRAAPVPEDLEAVPAARDDEQSEAVRVGAARTISEEIAAERAAMAAIVAEVAAHEPPPERFDDPDTDPQLQVPGALAEETTDREPAPEAATA